MANYYFLVDLKTQGATRKNNVLSRVAQKLGTRDLPHQIGHYRTSRDEKTILLQAEVTDAELTQINGLSYVTVLGQYRDGRADQSVLDYLNTHAAEWEAPGKPLDA